MGKVEMQLFKQPHEKIWKNDEICSFTEPKGASFFGTKFMVSHKSLTRGKHRYIEVSCQDF